MAGRIKVLSIDGGGIRGIIPAMILAELEAGIEKPLHKVFDLIAGTSTGGIIALGIGAACHGSGPYTPSELLRFYVRDGPDIFHQDWTTKLWQVFRPKYSPAPLERVLREFFGEKPLKSALTPLLITSYDLTSQRAFFFKSHRIAGHPAYDWEIADVARATSAAPTYFPPFHAVHTDGDYTLVDGGICVNNPAMAAYAEARRIYPAAEEIIVVSAGTGDRNDRIQYSSAKNRGLLGWAREIAPVMMDSVSEAVDYELDWLTGLRYFRFQPPVLAPASNALDDASASNLSNLQTVAREYIRSAQRDLQEACALLKEGRGSSLSGIGEQPPEGTPTPN
jgi:patatin-like phospholipase/acyl hydrolase